MKPTDYRTATFADLKALLAGLRLRVYEALKVHGPCTTEQLAAAMEPNNPLFILTVRPRVTELCQLGFAVLVGSSSVGPKSSTGGTYRALSDFEMSRLFETAKREASREQFLLKV